MKKTISIILFCLFSYFGMAQSYTDYLGAGHNNGITTTTSHDQNSNNSGEKTVDGFPVEDPQLLADASRFLAQATLGTDYETIQMAAAMGYEAWLDEQLNLPVKNIMDVVMEVWSDHEDPDEPEPVVEVTFFRSAWWELALKHPDQLRQKLNHALSQIFVVSSVGSDLFFDLGQLSGGYYDILEKNSFGNFRELLGAISLSPAMGLYLNHMYNPKSDPINNIHPDENFAREVMQLFTIGLYELNNDGSRKLDSSGHFIPTYDNNDIREFAKIFTGFGDGHVDGIWNDFGVEDVEASSLTPMKMYEEWHEQGPKTLLNGLVVPAGQTGMQDFNNAMDNLYTHPNVGPFIGKALIQFLVSSNPSPAYVERVADAFNDNGQGVRGDFKAIIKAILLDPEARDCNAVSNPTGGKLREPIVRYTNFMQAFNGVPTNGTFFTYMDRWFSRTGQIPLSSPSVFNFYLPGYQPNGPISNQDLVGPVFQIHNSISSIGFINETHAWTFLDSPFIYEDEDDPADSFPTAIVDLSAELAIANDANALVDRLNILLAAGQLSTGTKAIIANAISQLNDPEERVDMAIYLVMIAPDYAVLK